LKIKIFNKGLKMEKVYINLIGDLLVTDHVIILKRVKKWKKF